MQKKKKRLSILLQVATTSTELPWISSRGHTGFVYLETCMIFTLTTSVPGPRQLSSQDLDTQTPPTWSHGTAQGVEMKISSPQKFKVLYVASLQPSKSVKRSILGHCEGLIKTISTCLFTEAFRNGCRPTLKREQMPLMCSLMRKNPIKHF